MYVTGCLKHKANMVQGEGDFPLNMFISET